MCPHSDGNVTGALSCHVTTSRFPLLMLLALTKGVMHRNTQQQCHPPRSEPSTSLPQRQCVCYCHHRCGLHPMADLNMECCISQGEGSVYVSLAATRWGVSTSGSRMLHVVHAAWNLPSGAFVKESWQWNERIPTVISHQLWINLETSKAYKLHSDG